MKKTFIFLTTICAMMMLAACGKQSSKSNDTQSQSTQSSVATSKSSSKSSQKTVKKHEDTAMNLKQIQKGDYSSLLHGNWKMIGAKVNYHKGNGLEFDRSQVDGQISITRDKIVDGPLTLKRNSVSVDGNEEIAEVQNNGKTLSISTNNTDEKNWSITFYPAGTSNEYNNGSKNLITVWMSDDNYTEVFEEQNSDNNSKSSFFTKKKSNSNGLWDSSKDEELEAFVNKWSKTMDQDYQKYDGVNDLKTSVGTSYPSDLSKETVKGQQASIGWSKDGKGDYEYNVVAIYNHDGDVPPLPNHITYFFAYHNGEPVVLVDQSRDGTPDLTETQNAQLNAGFNRIAEN
ncbi:DUF4767 domain-containing protein [Pediococcus acidilactici]|uniref:DUF4767 domain-containing protein n=1 Tax=Pediococcus acidilactici TaxID=1254 RepID=UPI001F1B7AEE|nr:DUF4767 domain-containing protein [Pediococcus acidilactici]